MVHLWCGGLLGIERELQRLGDGWDEQVGRFERVQGDEIGGPVAFLRRLDGQAGFAHTPRTHNANQPTGGVGQVVGDLGAFGRAPHKRGQWVG